MKRLQTITAVAGTIALLSVPNAAHAAGFANTAHSATSSGMAGVATANSDEPNSSYYNPAAMPFSDSVNTYLGMTLIRPSVLYTNSDGTQTRTKDAWFPPPNVNVAIPFAEHYAFGVGVVFPFGLGIAYPDDWEGRETFRSQTLQTVNVNPNFAFKLPAIDLSVALGGQAVFASLEQERAFIAREDHEVDVLLGGSGKGFGAVAAVMFKPSKDYTIGLNYRSAVKINFDGLMHFNGIDGTPLESRFIDQAIATSVTLPHTINAGFGWQVIDELFLGFDVNYMTWSTYDQVEIKYSQQSPEGEPGQKTPSAVISADWHDAIALRLGAEYEVIDDLKLRTGFAYDMSPVPAETVSPSLPDNDRYVVSLGTGYTWNHIRADLAYQLVLVKERVIDNGSVDGTYQMGAHILGLNVGYGF